MKKKIAIVLAALFVMCMFFPTENSARIFAEEGSGEVIVDETSDEETTEDLDDGSDEGSFEDINSDMTAVDGDKDQVVPTIDDYGDTHGDDSAPVEEEIFVDDEVEEDYDKKIEEQILDVDEKLTMTGVYDFSKDKNISWKKVADKWYCYKKGKKLTGFCSYKGKKMYFDKTGALCTGWFKVNGHCYYGQTAGKPTDIQGEIFRGFQYIGKSRYHFGSNGILDTGWLKIGAYYYYADKTAAVGKGYGQIKAGRVAVGKRQYFFDNNGHLQIGWFDCNGSTYHANETGVLSDAFGALDTGITIIGGRKYLFSPEGKVQTGWLDCNGLTCYAREDGNHEGEMGAFFHYFNKFGNIMYFFNDDGVMQVGWQTILGKQYYFYKTDSYGHKRGEMAIGEVYIDGKYYHFGPNGVKYDTYDFNMDTKARNQTSASGMLVMIDCTGHHLGVYKGSAGNWECIKYFQVTTGAPETPTIKGRYVIGAQGIYYKMIYFDTEHVRCWYATRVYDGYHIHSVLYDYSDTPRNCVDPRLGMNLSHGCIRCELSNAKWVYDNVPGGTTVFIYD